MLSSLCKNQTLFSFSQLELTKNVYSVLKARVAISSSELIWIAS